MANRYTLELLMWILAAVLLFGVYHTYQTPVQYDKCPLCDGNRYQRMYAHLHGDTSEYKIDSPYHQRLFVPVLAALLPLSPPVANFHLINFIFTLLSVALIYTFWRNIGIKSLSIHIGLAILLLHWTGIIRQNQYDPFTVDVPIYFFQTLLLWTVWYARYEWLMLFAPLATLQKESFLGLLIVWGCGLLVKGIFDGSLQEAAWVWASAIFCIVVLLFAHSLYPATDSGDRSFLLTIAYHARMTVQNPLDLLRWIVALFTAYGGLLVLALLQLRFKYRYETFPNFLSLMLFTYLLYGILAGRDMTRIMFLGFPFIMTWILWHIQSEPRGVIVLAFLLTLPTMRLWNSIPDQTNNWAMYAAWLPEYASYDIVTSWAVFYLIIFEILRQAKKFYTPAPKSLWKTKKFSPKQPSDSFHVF